VVAARTDAASKVALARNGRAGYSTNEGSTARETAFRIEMK
jgi:hypothetical protein